MTRWILLLAFAAAPDETQVLAVVERLFAALAARDADAAARLLEKDGLFTRVTPDGAVGVQTHADFLKNLAAGREKYRERIWNPKVLVRGRLALVWAPYDFHIDGRFSHCGVDSFQLVRGSEGWKISGAAYTIETKGCPPSPLDARPRAKTKR
jgi:uncharacterized protein (TIGR02246 family)